MSLSDFTFEKGFVYSGNKDLGQFFTPELVTLFGVSLANNSLAAGNHIKILDPTCGNGAMLWVAHKYIKEHTGYSPSLYGIEVDEDVFPNINDAPFDISKDDVSLFNRDLFTTIFDSKMNKKVPGGIDLIIGNPPYVRYQSFSKLLQYFPLEITSYFSSNYPSLKESKVVIKILKCSLIASYLKINKIQEADLVLKGATSRTMTDKEKEWVELVKEIPGLSDLSIYTWFFSYTLLSKKGRLCFVAPNTWMSRDYGVVLKKFFQSFLVPEIVVSQNGNGWFQDAQVDTQIIICRPDLVNSEKHKVKLVEMNHSSNLSDLPVWGERDLGYIQKISKSIVDVKKEKRFSFGKVKLIGINSFLGLSDGNISDNDFKNFVPYEVSSLVKKFDGSLNTRTFKSIGVEINQGLRTGCNSFFYVKKIRDFKNHVMVKVDEEVGGGEYKIPKAYLKPVVKNQSCMSHVLTSKVEVENFAIVIPKGVMRERDVSGNKLVSDIISGELNNLLNIVEVCKVTRNGKENLIPELSAVVTNNTKENLKKDVPAGQWYNLSVQPRHYGDLYIPRVNGRNVYVGLNDATKKFLVDANFSTVTLTDNAKISVSALYAYLNSTFFRLILECSGNSMGGGALKLEGALLRKLPFINFSNEDLDKLTSLGLKLVGSSTIKDIYEVDKIIAGKIVDESEVEGFLKELINSYLEIVENRLMKSKSK